MTGIDPGFDAFAAFDVALVVRHICNVPLHGLHGVLGHGIGQAVGDRLPDVGDIEMGEVTSGEPGGTALRLILGPRTTGPHRSERASGPRSREVRSGAHASRLRFRSSK